MRAPHRTELARRLFQSYYESAFMKVRMPIKDWKFRHLRFELFSKRTVFHRIKDVLTDVEQLKQTIRTAIPKNAYYTPVKWLNPIYVAKTKTESDILLSSPLYFDIDMDELPEETFEAAKNTAMDLLDFFESEFCRVADLVVFSGRQGFHIYYWNWDFNQLKALSPEKRLFEFKKERETLLKKLNQKGIIVDQTVTPDPYRLMKIPGTLHGTTGLIAKPVDNLSTFNPAKHCLAFGVEIYTNIFEVNLDF